MRDHEGAERGQCLSCLDHENECWEFVPEAALVDPYSPSGEQKSSGEEIWTEVSQDEYWADPVLPCVRPQLDKARRRAFPVEERIGQAPGEKCVFCECPVERHEIVRTSSAEARSLGLARRLFEHVQLSHCISQSVHDTMHTSRSRGHFTYGEVNMLSFLRLLEWARRFLPESLSPGSPLGAFYDLGCGIGRPVVLAALHSASFRFSRCVGVELLPGIHKIALSLKDLYDREVLCNKAGGGVCESGTAPAAIDFVQGDLLEVSVGDASLVYIASTCFDAEMMARVGRRLAEQMPLGALVCTLRYALPNSGAQSEAFENMGELKIPMSWGLSDVFLHRLRNREQARGEKLIVEDKNVGATGWHPAGHMDLDAMD